MYIYIYTLKKSKSIKEHIMTLFLRFGGNVLKNHFK